MTVTTTASKPKLPKPRVCLALPGAGTALGVIAGALEVLDDPATDGGLLFVAVGGTSGGGLVALALAHGLVPSQISKMLDGFLQRKDLLDKSFNPFDQNPGLFRGAKIEGFLKDVFGAKTKLGDLHIPARVCVWDSWIREPAVLCSDKHPDVLVWRAARATMAIEFFFDLVRVRPDNARLYGDGGLVLNVPYGLWDDRPEPTIGMRFSDQHPTFDVHALIETGKGNTVPASGVQPVRSYSDLVPAVTKTLLSTASAAWPSKKTGGLFQEVVLETDANALEFGLAPTEIARRRQHGRLSAQRAKLRL